jgi:hypothetical protein
MKYKNIRSMAHNWSHSFMSYMNYVDEAVVCEELYALARQRRGERIVVSWVPQDPAAEATLPARTQKSLGFYRGGLEKHMLSHNVDPSAVRQFRTEIWVDSSHRMNVRAVAIDDRGKGHEAYVWT